MELKTENMVICFPIFIFQHNTKLDWQDGLINLSAFVMDRNVKDILNIKKYQKYLHKRDERGS
jgi:hypothetical protein